MQNRLEEKDDVVALALLLMRRTGIRIGDLRALPFDCLRVDPTGNPYLKIPIGKLNNERFVPLDVTTLSTLKEIKKRSLQNNGGVEPEVLVVRRDGASATLTNYHLVLYEIGEELRLDTELSLGGEQLVSHRLRHTFATTLLSAGMTIESIKELLGHRSLHMTLRYAQVTPQKLRNDYLKAITTIEENVVAPEIASTNTPSSLRALLNEALMRLRSQVRDGSADKRQITALIRRFERLRSELNKIED